MRKQLESYINKFIQDKNNKVVLFQPPNIPIIGWFVFIVISLLIPSGPIQAGFANISQAFLFLWAYLEITDGASYFRRFLGVVVILLVIKSYFN
jgi:hypothetical protein